MKSIMLKKLIKISVFAFLCLAFFGFAKVQANAGELTMHTINIGHGDAHLLESKGHYMLVDSGKKNAHTTLLNYLEKHITGDTIDYVLATHADTDHIGGFASVFKNYDIKHCIYGEPMKPLTKGGDEEDESDDELSNYGKFVKALQDEPGLDYENAHEGQTWTFGDATVEVIYDGRKGSTYNESSIVVKVSCDNKTILMTGDLPTTMEDKLMAGKNNFNKKYDFKADVLKVAHHGAGASTSTKFLEAVDPQYAVIPNGVTEEGTIFPKDSVLQRLALRFIKTYLSTEGDIVLNIKDNVISTDHKENTKFLSITKGQVVVNASKIYCPNTVGKRVTPSVHLYAFGELIDSSHYKVSYTDNNHTGFATVKVTGNKKKYIGSLSTTFPILPRLSKIWKYSRSKNRKQITIQWSAQKYATSYTIWYSSDRKMVKDSKKIKIKGGKNCKKTFKGLKKKKHYYFKIQAYKKNVGKGKWTTKKKIK